MRKSSLYVFLMLFNFFLLSFFLFIYPHMRADDFKKRIAEQRQLVSKFRLTDLCLFTEASYTRNLALADFHAPFQDYPMAFEHFPSGSITIPSILISGSLK